MKKINPSIGGYFKHNNIVYLAKEPSVRNGCMGCCFRIRYAAHTECEAPDNLDCNGKIFEDVTDRIEVELVEPHGGGVITALLIMGLSMFFMWAYWNAGLGILQLIHNL